MKIKSLSIIILSLISQLSFAQIFDNSQAHFSVEWKQINSKNFRLIFPKEFTKSAPTLADQIEVFLTKTATEFKRKPKKINIIVQGNHIEQNGFVQLAARKSELYATPSGISDNQEWLPNLALHELTHVAQFDNLTGKLKAPFGEQLALAFFGLHLPSWFYEGQAVLNETQFSQGGRGRLASWEMPIRANIASNLNFSFNKYIHGSFKNIVPSYYTIGYFMSSEMQQKDPQIFNKIFEDMNEKLLRPFSFQKSLKKFYGARASEIFKISIANLTSKLKIPNDSVSENQIKFDDKYPTNYLLPQVIDNRIYSIEDSRQKTNRIIEIDQKTILKKTEIITTGIQLTPYFHVSKDLIVWDEFRKDARFEKQTYNVINVYNRNTKSKKTISKNSRYYTPVISPDQQKIACVEVNLANETSIAILNINDGTKLDSIGLPQGLHIQQPNYHASGDKIISIGISHDGTNLIEIDLKNKSIKPLLDWTNLQFERPSYDLDDIIFKANQQNKDDIFRLSGGNIYQLTNSKFGAFTPSVSDNKIWFSDYSTQGHKINSINKENSSALTKTSLIVAKTRYAHQDSIQDSNATTAAKEYNIENYSRLKHSFNFHSISFSGNDFENFDNLKPGIFWLSNDILNTTQTKIGYEYDTDIQKSTYSAEITYQTFYPKITVGYKNTGSLAWAKKGNSQDSLIRFDWRENQYYSNIEIPFSVYRGNNTYSYGLNFGTYYIQRYDITQKVSNFSNEVKFPLAYQAYFSKNNLRSLMDLAPRWGQSISFTVRHSPFESGNHHSYALRTSFFFPGLALNHSLQARFSLQETKGRFANIYDIPVPEGYNYFPIETLKNSLLFDYRLPLMYPDFSIGQFAYLKRVHGLISADYINLHQSTLAPQATTIGLNFDFNLFKYNLPVFTFTAKATYLNHNALNTNLIRTFSLSYSY